MRALILLYLFTFLNCSWSYGQVGMNSIKQFMSDVTLNNKRKTVVQQPYLISTKTIDLFKSISLEDGILSISQIDEIYSDIILSTRFIWSEFLLDSVNFISLQQYDSLTSKNYPFKLYKYSRPVFTKNKNYCLLFTDWECGPMCGGWYMQLYKKEKEHWAAVKTYLYSDE